MLNYSLIAKQYKLDNLNRNSKKVFQKNSRTDFMNPDFVITGAEVSRYTFLEYLKFLKFDIKMKNSSYISYLNKKCLLEQASIPLLDPRFGVCEKITLKKLEMAIQKFCLEYKGHNWDLSERMDIPYANDSNLWNKVDLLWQCSKNIDHSKNER